jgi:hypothetical protein
MKSENRDVFTAYINRFTYLVGFDVWDSNTNEAARHYSFSKIEENKWTHILISCNSVEMGVGVNGTSFGRYKPITIEGIFSFFFELVDMIFCTILNNISQRYQLIKLRCS